MEELKQLILENLEPDQIKNMLENKQKVLQDAIEANLYLPIANLVCEYDGWEKDLEQVSRNNKAKDKNLIVAKEQALVIQFIKWLQSKKKSVSKN